MKVKVNNRDKIVPIDCTLSLLAEIVGINPNEGVALAVGTEIIPKEKWDTYQLKDNDKIIIVKATCGG